jgi:hypothetical protein
VIIKIQRIDGLPKKQVTPPPEVYEENKKRQYPYW